MITRLVEFQNSRSITLRGIIVESSNINGQTALLCVPGFEGISSTEPKFIELTKKLFSSPANRIRTVLRYDPTGIGLSDGEYYPTTIETLVDDLSHAVYDVLSSFDQFIFVGHSIGSCIITRFLSLNQTRINVEKIIFLAPALNQHDLHRYWYLRQTNPSLTWKEFLSIFQEDDFQTYLNSKPNDAFKSQRAHKILHEFIRLCSTQEFSHSLSDYNHRLTMHIHGDKDAVVPIESVKTSFKNTLIMNTADHELEEPDILNEWTNKAVQYILGESIDLLKEDN